MSYKLVPPDQVPYTELSPGNLVDLLAYKSLTATELRRVRLTDAARGALIAGLDHPNPKVRWWCLQLMDHVGDEPCFEHIIRALDDPVPRVRAMALHALECERCKQSPAMVDAARAILARQVALRASVETAG
jgi:HEAT repeat protein